MQPSAISPSKHLFVSIPGMLSVTYKSRLWIVSMLAAVGVAERTSVNTRIVQTLMFPCALHCNSWVPQLEREELQWAVGTTRFLQMSATSKDKKYLHYRMSFPFQRRNRRVKREVSYLLILSEICLRKGEQATTTNNFQAARTLLSWFDLWAVTLVIFFQKSTDNSLLYQDTLWNGVSMLFISRKTCWVL